MKSIIITIALTLVASVSFAQATKKDTAKKAAPKPQQEYFVKVPADVYFNMLNAIHDYRDILIYSPLIKTADEKINTQAAIDRALVPLKELRVDSLVKKQ